MPVETDIASYLSSLSTVTYGTLGTNLFDGVLPPSPDACVGILPYGGSPPELSWGAENPRIQVLVRGANAGASTDYSDARAKANSIFRALHLAKNITVSGRLYYCIKATGSVEFLENDQNNRPLFSVNFEVIKALE
jgi:hypothetical protein